MVRPSLSGSDLFGCLRASREARALDEEKGARGGHGQIESAGVVTLSHCGQQGIAALVVMRLDFYGLALRFSRFRHCAACALAIKGSRP